MFLKTSSDIWGFVAGACALVSAMLASHTMIPAAIARLGRLDQTLMVVFLPIRRQARSIHARRRRHPSTGCIRNRLRYHLPSDGSGKGRF
jgi:hypothetical protein